MGNGNRKQPQIAKAPAEPKERETFSFSCTGSTPAGAFRQLSKEIAKMEEEPDFFVVSVDHSMLCVPNGFFASAIVVRSRVPLTA